MGTIKAVIGKIKKCGEVKYDISFLPDNTTWITIDSREFGVPREGDVVEVEPPKVVGLTRVKDEALKAAKTDPFLCIDCGESWNPIKEDKCSNCGNQVPF